MDTLVTYDELVTQVQTLTRKLETARQKISAAQKTESAVQSLTAQNTAILSNIEDGYFEMDEKGHAASFNPALEKIFGLSRDELLSINLFDCFSLNSIQQIQQAIEGMNHAAAPVVLENLEILHKKGHKRNLSVTFIPQQNNGVPDTRFHVIVKDFTDMKNAGQNYEEIQNEFERLFERSNNMAVEAEIARIELNQIFNTVGEGVWVIDEGFTVQRVNVTFLNTLEKSEIDVIGKKCYDICHGRICRTPGCPLVQIMEGAGYIECDMERTNADETVTPYILTATPFQGLGGERIGIVESFKDITLRKRAEAALQKANQELERLAMVDGLTQVANRRQFDTFLGKEWRRMGREKQPLSMIMSDVDCFKLYNDYYGHQMGDECLKKVAKALAGRVKRPADLAARYGGEEFAVILPNTPGAGALHVARCICDAVRALQIPHEKSPVHSHVTLSLGVACLIPHPGSSPETLIKLADRALYKAKETGRNQAVFRDFG